MLERRRFLKGSGIAVGLAALGPLTLFSAPRRVRAGSFGPFSKAKFESLVGSWVHVDLGEGAGWEAVQLIEVLDAPESATVEQFWVRFSASRQVDLEPGIYAVDAGSAGAFELYLEPAESGSSSSDLTASFSLIRPLQPSCAGVSAQA